MSDTNYPTFQHYGTNAQRLAFTPAPASGTQPLYIWYETDTNNYYIFTTTWQGPFAAAGGTVTHTAGALTAGDLVVGNGSADLKTVAATDGQIPIGRTSDGNVVLATLTAGSNVTITNAAGAVTIAASGGGAAAPSFAFFIA